MDEVHLPVPTDVIVSFLLGVDCVEPCVRAGPSQGPGQHLAGSPAHKHKAAMTTCHSKENGRF